MKIAVLEDEKCITDMLNDCIGNFMSDAGLDFDVDIFYCGRDFEKANKTYDLLFLDFQLPDMNGMKIAGDLRLKGCDTAIIFVTAYSEYIYESFEVAPFRYILKPIDKKIIENALNAFILSYNEAKTVAVPTAKRTFYINVNDIIYIESNGKYSIVRLKDIGEYKSLKSISDFDCELDSYSFFRTHRRFIVNMNHIDNIAGNIITFVNGEKAEISRRNVAQFNKSYINFLKTSVK